MGATGAPGERSLGSANVLDVETHDSVVTLRRDGEVSRGLKAFIQSWNRSLNVLIAPHYDYAGLANQHATLGGAAKVRRNTHTVCSRSVCWLLTS